MRLGGFVLDGLSEGAVLREGLSDGMALGSSLGIILGTREALGP